MPVKLLNSLAPKRDDALINPALSFHKADSDL